MKRSNKHNKDKMIIYTIIIMINVYIAFFTLYSSPIINYIGEVDSAVFKIMGQALINGKTIYTDLFDHKGIITYIINAIGIIINPDIGLFIVECILTSIGAIYIFKTAKIYTNNYGSMMCTLLYLLLTYIKISGGNYTEEYALTFSAIALYHIIKIIHLDEVSKKSNWIIIGITFAINFFIKPTYISIWIAFGITILIFLIKKKEYKKLFHGICYAIVGILIIMLPILIYFIIKNNMGDFINAYFNMNMKYSESTITEKVKMGIYLLLHERYLWYTIFLLSINIYVLKNKQIKMEERVFCSLFFLVTLILTMMAPNPYPHYLMQNAIAFTYPILLFCTYEKLSISSPSTIKAISIGICAVIFINSIQAYKKGRLLSKRYNTYVAPKLEEIKKEYIKEGDEILTLGNDVWMHIHLNKFPEFKYFFQYPIIKYDEKISQETIQYIKEKRPKVIFIGEVDIIELMKNIEPFLKENYIHYTSSTIRHYFVLKDN